MALMYDEMAKDRDTIIVNACGFGYIPAEMGTIFLENKFNGKYALYILFEVE